MKNLKKLVSVVLSLAMVISTMAVTVSAKSFGDVDTTAGYYEAVNVLSDLAILEGDEQGNFNGDADIKRSEFAAVVCRAMGQENAANGSKGTTTFTDVAADHWASGYINWAAQQKIVNGKGNGIFDPDAPVKYEEAIKMLVVALGYEPLAQNKGGYPTGYFVVAASNAINSGVSLNGSANAPRKVVAQLTYNALDVPLMDAGSITVGGYNEYNIYDGTDNTRRTLLSYYHDITKVKAKVNATAITSERLAKKNGDNQVELDLINAYKFDWEDILDGNYDNDKFSSITLSVGETNAEDYLGYTVVAYIGLDDNDDYVLKAITPDTKSVDLLEVTDNIEVSNYATRSFEYYENENDLRTQKVDLVGKDKELTVYLNGKALDSAAAAATLFDSLKDETASKIVFMGDKSAGEYDKVFVTQYRYGLVEEVKLEDELVKFTESDCGTYTLDLSKETRGDKFTYSLTLEDGTPIELKDLQENDVLNIICANPGSIGDDDDSIIYMDIVVTRKSVEGAVTEEVKKNEKYIINGEEYKLNAKTEPRVDVGDTGRYFLTIDNKVLAVDSNWESDEAGTSRNYGFITKIGATDQFGELTYQVKMFTTDGSFVTLDVADSLVYYEGENKTTLKKDTTDADKSQDTLFFDASMVKETTTTATGKLYAAVYDSNNVYESIPLRLVRYKLNASNEIKELRTAAKSTDSSIFNYSAPTDKNYKANSEKFCGKTFNSKSALIYVPVTQATDTIDEDKLEVISFTSLDEDENFPNSFLFDIDKNNEIGVAIATAGVTASRKSALAIATSVSTVQDDLIKVGFFQNGEFGSYVISDTCKELEDIAVGDVFQYSLNGDEIVKGTIITTLDADGKVVSAGADDSESIKYVITDKIDTVKSKYFTDAKDVDYNFAPASEVGTVAIYNTAREGRNAVSKVSGLSGLKESGTQYYYIAVVKTDDGDVTDAIAFQYKTEKVSE